jgi:hypothetical protein
VAAPLSHFGIVSDILSLVVNGSEALVVARRDKDATRRGLLPFDEACARIAGPLWTDYVTTWDAARDARERLSDYERKGFKPFTLLDPDQKRLHDLSNAAKAALDTFVHGCLERGEHELWARRNDRTAELKQVPASAIEVLRFDYQKHAARGDGLPPLYDLHMRLLSAAPVKRWRKPPQKENIRAALENILEVDPTLSGEALESALRDRVGEGMTRARARSEIKQSAPQAVKPRGRPRTNKSPK